MFFSLSPSGLTAAAAVTVTSWSFLLLLFYLISGVSGSPIFMAVFMIVRVKLNVGSGQKGEPRSAGQGGFCSF